MSTIGSTGTALRLNTNNRGKNLANDHLWYGGSVERATTTPGRTTFKAFTPHFHNTPRLYRNTQRGGLRYEGLEVESQYLTFINFLKSSRWL